MPELPEVETVRRGLEPAMTGRKIVRARNNRPDLRFAFPDQFADRLSGQTIERLDRRSKYLLARLSSGETLLMHLGMSGRFTITDNAASPEKPGRFFHAAPTDPKHDHVVFEIEDAITVTYNDPRRFGFMTLYETDQEDQNRYISVLGPEPNTNAFSAAHLAEAFAGKRSPVKTGLLDQSIVAGLGNIYVCEALWRAQILPTRLCQSLKETELEALAQAARQVINEAIEAGGSTLRDFAGADGAMGYFQHNFDVYGREGEPCRRCGAPEIFRVVQSNRSSFYCSSCQF